MNNLRPSFDVVDPNEPPSLRLQRRYRPFVQALATLVEVAHDQSPFYASEIAERVERVIAVARREQVDVSTNIDRIGQGDWYVRGQENFDELLKAAQQLSEAIRSRVAALAIGNS